MKVLGFILSGMLGFLSLTLHAHDINFQTESACKSAMEDYYTQAMSLENSDHTLGYMLWFSTFKQNAQSTGESCENGVCVRTYSVGGCGALAFSNHKLYDLAKPLLQEELAHFDAGDESLAPQSIQYQCHYVKGQDPIGEGSCELILS